MASLAAFVLFSCDDSTDTLGLNINPGYDVITSNAASFDVATSTVLAGPVYAKTSMGYLGKYTDPNFGTFESDFLTQLTCTDQFKFPLERMVPVDPSASVKKYEATAASINLYYSSYFGDSLNTCRLSVYELNKDLVKDNQNYYTNIDPNQYYDAFTGLIGRKAYSAVDLSVSEATRKLSTFYPNVSVDFPLSKANEYIKLYQTTSAKGTSFKDEFAKALKGLYIKCDHGDGTILYVDQVHLNISFKVYATDSLGHFPIKRKQAGYTDVDSTYTTTAAFGSTKEVIQANSFKNDQTLENLANITDYTLIKSPAGLVTKAAIPVGKVYSTLSKDTINSAKLSFSAYNSATTNTFGMTPPSYLLMVRAKDFKNFFETNSVPNNITSFLGVYTPPQTATNNSTSYQYVFSNISKLITTCAAEAKQANGSVSAGLTEDVLLVPVVVIRDANGGVQSLRHDLKPGYVKLKGGKDNNLKLEIVYSTFNK